MIFEMVAWRGVLFDFLIVEWSSCREDIDGSFSFGVGSW